MRSFLLAAVLALPAAAFVVPAPRASSLAPSRPTSILSTPQQTQHKQHASRLMAMSKQIGVGVIGAGRIGIVHLEALAGW